MKYFSKIFITFLFHACALSAIATQPDSVALGEVVVTARRPDAVVTAGKISFNPSATLAADGSGTLDAIWDMPGVTVDSNGSISVNGRSDVTVTVDGRKGMLRGDALVNYLKSLSVSAVQRIEISTMPSASLDATDSPTVINIRLKPRRDEGYSLSLSTNGRAVRGWRGFGNMFATYSNGPAHITLSYALMGAKNPSRLSTTRPYPDSPSPLTQEYSRTRRDAMNNISLTADFNMSQSLTSGLSFTFNNYDRRENATMHTMLPQATVPEITLNRTDFDTRNIYGSAFVKFAPSGGDTRAALYFDFFNYRSSENQDMDSDNGGALDGNSGGTTWGYAGTFDFSTRLQAGFKLSAGAKFSLVDMRHDGKYDGLENETSGFGYIEDTEALFAEASAGSGRFTATAGVRAERSGMRTRFSGNEAEGPTRGITDSFDWFPSLAATYASGGNSFAASYTRRIARPRYSDLNPFIHIYDDITHIGGNISLRPATSHNVALSWATGGRFRVEAAGSVTRNAITRCFREITDRVVYVSPENLPRHIMYSLTVSAMNLRPFPWLTASLTVSVAGNCYRFPSGSGIASNNSITPLAQGRLMFTLPSDWSAELSGNFHGQMAQGQATVSAAGMLYIGVRKSFLGGKANASVFVRDLLDTSRVRSRIELSGGRATLVEREFEDMRRVGVSFSIRFSQGAVRKAASTRNNLKDEINRVNL